MYVWNKRISVATGMGMGMRINLAYQPITKDEERIEIERVCVHVRDVLK